MKIFKDINYIFNFDEFKKTYKIGDNKGLSDSLKQLVEDVLPLVNPKAVYKVSYVEDRFAESVEIDGVEFKSKMLRENLGDIERVFPFIVTCGKEVDEYMQDIDNYLDRYWLDVIKEDAMRYASEFLENYLREKYEIKQLASMNPGSGDLNLWPIEEQKKLFSLFGNTEEIIDVKLTDSYLMIPNKSVSGIYFPTDIKYVNCKYCSRGKCPNRKAPFSTDKRNGEI